MDFKRGNKKCFVVIEREFFFKLNVNDKPSAVFLILKRKIEPHRYIENIARKLVNLNFYVVFIWLIIKLYYL
jgi:hypothetical protein